jgi:hypothetical protein
MVDSHLAQSIANGLNIAGVTKPQPTNSHLDAGLCSGISQFL